MQSTSRLLVIDMQVCAFDSQITPPIDERAKLLDKVAELIQVFRRLKLHIIFIQTCALSGQPYAKDTHGWEIHSRMKIGDEDKSVHKAQSNAFKNTKLQEVLSSLHITGLVTCGIWSEYCVTNTTIAALEQGYQTCIASDAHSTVAGSNSKAIRKTEE